MLEVSQLIGFGAGGAENTIQFVGANQRTTAGVLSLTALTGGIDTAARAGDLVIVAIGDDGSSNQDLTISTPSGYAELADLYANDSGPDPELGVFWKLMGGTPDTSVTIPSYTGPSAIAYVLRGVNQSTPIDATTVPATGIDGTAIDPGAITTVTPNALVVAIMCATSDTDGVTVTPPTGYTNLSNIPSGTPNQNLAVASKTVPSPGVENPDAFTGLVVSGSRAWCAATVAIRPA
jgi:hypothetical protein